jgi:O-antigen ligase
MALAPGFAAKGALCLPLVAIPLVWWMLGGANRWLGLFLFAALLLPPLPLAIGDSGPHVALLFAAFGLLVGVLRAPAWRFHPDALAASLLAFFAILFGSLAMAAVYSGFAVAAGSLARVLLFGIAVYVFLFLRDGPGRMAPERKLQFLRLLFFAAAASALFACIDFYFQFPAPGGYGPQFIWLDSGVFRRAQGVFYEASTLGNLCAFFLEMIAVSLFRPRAQRPVSLPAMLFGGAALATALVLSYSRASLLNLAVAILVLLWLHRHRIRIRRLALGAALSVSAAVGILAGAFPIFARAYWLRVATSFQYFFESPNAVLSGRIYNWEILRDFLISHPLHLLLGVGYKTLPYSDFIGGAAIADNTYLSALVETGIMGLLAVLALNAAILTAACRAARASDPMRSFCGAWMLCFWAGQTVQMFSADLLTYWRVLPVYFALLALAAQDERPVS